MKNKKASDNQEGEGYFDAYAAAGHEQALLRGKGGCGREDVPEPGTLLCDIPTGWSRPFAGYWPENMLAEEAGSRENQETCVENRDAERAYALADKNTPGDKRYDLSAAADADD